MAKQIEFICNQCKNSWKISKKELNKLEKIASIKNKLLADPMCTCDRFGDKYLEEIEDSIKQLNNIKKCCKCESSDITLNNI